MSRGQTPRTPQNFPDMNYRAERRRLRRTRKRYARFRQRYITPWVITGGDPLYVTTWALPVGQEARR